MTFRLVGVDLVLAPLILGTVPIATLRAMDAVGVPLAVTLGGLVSLTVSILLVRIELSDARWWRTHFRHSLFVYPWFLLSAMVLGEGLTAGASKPIAIMTAVLVVANALPMWALRHRPV